MKRRSADRPDWQRVLARRFAVQYIEDPEFAGYVTYLHLDRVREPLFVTYDAAPVCVAADGFGWMQQFPAGEPYTVTTMFDRAGEVVQWYIDVCERHGLDDRGMPWIDDMYLDVVLEPHGAIHVLDRDELEEALALGRVTPNEYQRAYATLDDILSRLRSGRFSLIARSQAHRSLLQARLPT